MRNLLRLFIITVSILTSCIALAATVEGGKVIVRVDDGSTSRCINSSTDKITMVLRRIIVNKDVGAFKVDRAAAIVINTTIAGDEEGSEKQVSFPRMFTASVESYANGLTSIPAEQKIFSNFALKSSESTYSSAEVAFNILTKKDKGPFGVALSALNDVSKQLPLPANPFTPAFQFFADYSNSVLDASLSKNNNVGENLNEGKIVFTFSSNGTCVGDQEKTGTVAVISGSKINGAVNINEEHCWKAELKPVFLLKAAPKSASDCSQIASTDFKTIKNPYYAFYLNAEPKVLASSRVAEVKTITMPSVNNSIVSLGDVKKYLMQSYVGLSKQNQPFFESTADKVASSLNVNTFLKSNAANITERSGQKIEFTTTVEQSQAIDVAESLNRCAAHGMTEYCF